MLEKSLLGTLICKNFNSRTDLFRSLGIDSLPGGTDFLESIPGHLKCLQIPVLFSLLENIHTIMTYAMNRRIGFLLNCSTCTSNKIHLHDITIPHKEKKN